MHICTLDRLASCAPGIVIGLPLGRRPDTAGTWDFIALLFSSQLPNDTVRGQSFALQQQREIVVHRIRKKRCYTLLLHLTLPNA